MGSWLSRWQQRDALAGSIHAACSQRLEWPGSCNCDRDAYRPGLSRDGDDSAAVGAPPPSVPASCAAARCKVTGWWPRDPIAMFAIRFISGPGCSDLLPRFLCHPAEPHSFYLRSASSPYFLSPRKSASSPFSWAKSTSTTLSLFPVYGLVSAPLMLLRRRPPLATGSSCRNLSDRLYAMLRDLRVALQRAHPDPVPAHLLRPLPGHARVYETTPGRRGSIARIRDFAGVRCALRFGRLPPWHRAPGWLHCPAMERRRWDPDTAGANCSDFPYSSGQESEVRLFLKKSRYQIGLHRIHQKQNCYALVCFACFFPTPWDLR